MPAATFSLLINCLGGLFEVPKYPFLYFALGNEKKLHNLIPLRNAYNFKWLHTDTYSTIITAEGKEEALYASDGVPNNRLSFRFDHVRNDEEGAVLSNGIVTCKLTEMVKADPFGLGGEVDVGDEVVIGSATIKFLGIS